MSLEKAKALLESLAHEDVLETPGTHSRSRNVSASGFTFAAHLGPRRLFNFTGIHTPALRAALADCPPSPERGRLLRLLGDTAAAQAQLRATVDSDGSGRAAAWLGESLLNTDPAQAVEWLQRGASELWLAAAHLQLKSWDKALAALDRFKGKTPLAELLRCQTLLETGDKEGAFRAAEAAIALDSATCAGYGMAGYVRIAQGDVEGALSYYNKARDRDPELGGSHLLQGLGIRVDWDDPHAYLKTLDAMIARHPTMAALYAERAELKRDPRLCLYEEGERDYARAAELDPKAAWILAVLARAQNYSKGLRAGMAAFDRALELSPESGWIWAWRAEAWRGLGETAKALSDSDRAVALMPWYSFAYAWRGALRRGLGRFEEAEADLSAAIRLEPEYLFSYYERFQCRRLLRDWSGALEDLNRAYREDPKYSWLGRASRGTPAQGYESQLRDLDAAVAAHPKQAWFLAWRGYSWLQLEQPERAIADLDAALAIDPGLALACAWRGWARKEAGQPDAAAADLQEAVRLDPGIWFAWSMLCDLCQSRGDSDGALRAITKVTELAPTGATGHYRKALLEFAGGAVASALSDVQKAVQLDRRYAAAYLLRGVLRQRAGDLEGQIADFKQAFTLDPGLFPEDQREEVAKMLQS